MNENQAYTPGAERPIQATKSNIPMDDKVPEYPAIMDKTGRIWIHSQNQSNALETEKTQNGQVVRSPMYGYQDQSVP